MWDVVGSVLCDFISYCLLLYQVSVPDVSWNIVRHGSEAAEHGYHAACVAFMIWVVLWNCRSYRHRVVIHVRYVRSKNGSV